MNSRLSVEVIYRVAGIYHYWRRILRLYTNYVLLKKFPGRWVDHGFLFIHIPKTAGSSIRSVLIEAAGGTDVRPRLWHPPAHIWKAALGTPRYNKLFKFAIVRHPVSRLFSGFNYLMNRRPLPWLASYIQIKGWSFEEFVMEWLVPSRKRTRFAFFDLFWPQTWFITSWKKTSPIIVAYVGRVESLDRDWLTIRHHLKQISGLSLPETLPHRNVGSYERTALKNIDRLVLERIALFYEEDYTLLGYDPFDVII